MNEVVDGGNAIRIANFRSQESRAGPVENAMNTFEDEITSKLESIKAITRGRTWIE